MAIQIKAPDGSIAQFPDGTSDQTIQSVMAKTYGGPTSPGLDMAAPSPTHGQMVALSMSPQQRQASLANTNPNMSPLEDVGRSAVSGLQQGASALVGSVGDLRDMGTAGFNKALDLEGKAFGIPAQKVAAYRQQMADVMSSPIAQAMPYVHAIQAAPTTAQVNAARQTVTGPDHDPQTTGGKYARTIAQFVPAAVMTPGGILSKVASVVIPGAASEGAGQLAAPMGPGWETAARIAGGLAGGAAVGVGQGLVRAPEATMGSTIPGLTEEQMTAAQTLRQNAAARGLDVTLPEAVNQVTNGQNVGLSSMQRVLEGTRQGEALSAPYFAARPGQVQGAVGNYMDTIAPATDQPSMIGMQAQDAASTAINAARRGVNAAAEPYYAALPAQSMPAEQYAQIASNPSYRRALLAIRQDPELGAAVAHLPDNNLSVINEVSKHLQTTADQAAGTVMSPGNNYLAGLRSGAKTLADAAAGPPGSDYANARSTVARLSATNVDPLRAGPLGQISGTQAVPTQTAALFPSGPLQGAPAETAQAAGALNQAAPGTADALTRQHLAMAIDASMRRLSGRPNQAAGAKFANLIAGQPDQESTLMSGIGALPQGAAKAQDLDSLLEALRATGWRQAQGSKTAFNTDALNSLKTSQIAKGITNFDIVQPLKGIGDIIDRANYGRNVNRLLAMVLSDPNQTKAILRAAQRAAPRSSLLPPIAVNAASGATSSQNGQ